MVRSFRPGLVERLLGDLFRVVNRRIVWYRLGFLLIRSQPGRAADQLAPLQSL